MLKNFEIIIGLEVHAELTTASKMYSPSRASFHAPPNTNIHEIDLGYPGTLPVVNKRALEYALKGALALHMEITKEMHFDRKNYFYPDNPKGYQITQQNTPIGQKGYIDITLLSGEEKRIGITRLHMEEDAGKGTHRDQDTLLDYNRQGIPLVEIVSEPDLRSGVEAKLYLQELKSILEYLNISDVKMEEGSLRVDANVSVRPFGQKTFNEKVEIKNINSFSNVERAIDLEVERQIEEYLSGGIVFAETRRYDDTTKKNIMMRRKETAEDYRYFPEPDLPQISLTDEEIERVRADLPELPKEKRERYIMEYKLSKEDVAVLLNSRELTYFFDEVVQHTTSYKLALNYVTQILTEYLKKEGKELSETYMTPQKLSDLIVRVENFETSTNQAKKAIPILCNEDQSTEVLIEKYDLKQITDRAVIQTYIDDVIHQNQKSVQDYKNGKDRAFKALMGQVMGKAKGKANPEIVHECLEKTLQELPEIL